jgi:phospholipase/carboxylesterase
MILISRAIYRYWEMLAKRVLSLCLRPAAEKFMPRSDRSRLPLHRASIRGHSIVFFRAERMNPMVLDWQRLAPLSRGKAAYLVVVLHGVNAMGRDVVYLARAWQKLLPEAEFAVPDAPLPSDEAPNLRQWFSLRNRAPEKLLAGLREACPILDRFLDELLAARQFGDTRLALTGFSQGATMALYTGLQRQRQVAGVAAFSGSLPLADGLQGDIRSKPPVLLVHGEADNVVPFRSMANVKAILEVADIPVSAVARPGLGHEIDGVGVALGGDFLRGALRVQQDKTGPAV